MTKYIGQLKDNENLIYPVTIAEAVEGLGDLALINSPLPITNGGTEATNADDAKINLGLSNVENKSSATIRDEITFSNIVNALTSPLPINNGGTGCQTFTEGSFLVGNGINPLQEKTLSEVFTDIGAMAKPTLLWSNASPTSTFAAQTISLDLSTYNYVYIENCYASGSSNYLYRRTELFPKGCTGTMLNSSFFTWLSSRRATIVDSGITFSNGKYAYVGDTGHGEGANYCIPLKIYGVNI